MPLANTYDTDEHRAGLLKVLRSLTQDFKAAVVAAEVTSTSLDADDVYFRNQSTFKRQVSKDIAGIFWSDAEDLSYQLVFDLNREGIYDMLPEAVAHSQASSKRSSNDAGIRHGIILRQEEKNARIFFSPIENEFAHRGLRLDTMERELLSNDNPSRTRQFFEYFFGDSSILTDNQVVVLSYILPLCHKIRGDAGLVSVAVSKILGYKVQVEQYQSSQITTVLSPTPPLGDNLLSIDSVLGDGFRAPVSQYVIRIADVASSEFSDFHGGGKHANVITFITDYFFPADAQISVQPECADEEKYMSIPDGDSISILDFNSYI